MKNLVRFEITPGRLCLLGLASLMVLCMYGVALILPEESFSRSSHSPSLPQHTLNQTASQPGPEPEPPIAGVTAVSAPARPIESEGPSKEPLSEGIETGVQVGDIEAVTAQTVGELQSVFQKHAFTLAICGTSGCIEVPRLELLCLPQDLKSLEGDSKKDLFLQTHLPLILKANEAILGERARLEAIIARTKGRVKALSKKDKKWVATMMEKYRLSRWDLKELLMRIDVLPPSLALGQSAVESGWGTSFAARKKNSTFGMTVGNRVLEYETLQACVDAYIRNINANPAYRELRQIRARLREEGADICSVALTEGLVKYSELGRSYIKKIQAIIESNNLQRFDTAQLMTSSSDADASEKA